MQLQKTYSGECLCGQTRYSIQGDLPKGMFLCHCSRCRKETGSAHGANVFFEDASLHWEKGELNLGFFKVPGTRHSRAFCKICASPMPRLEGEKHLVLPAGSLDDDSMLKATAHIFFGSKASWDEDLTLIPKFEGLPH